MQLFKPNAKNGGHAIGFSFNSKTGKLYTQIIKQVSWDDKSKRGRFSGGQTFTVTFNATEIAAILNCFERSQSATLFHSAEKGATSITWAPFVRGVKKEGEPAPVKREGITISVNPRGGDEATKKPQFGFWFTENEARLLKEYLQFVLSHFFAAEYSADKQRRMESLKKKNAQATGSPVPAPAAEEDVF